MKTDTITVKTSAFGVTPDRAAALARSVTKHRAVARFLGGSRHRLLSFEILDADAETKPARPTPHDRFRRLNRTGVVYYLASFVKGK